MAEALDDGDWQRPPPESIKLAFDRIFRSRLTVPLLREAALDGRALVTERSAGHGHDFIRTPADGVVGRSILWKLFLLPASPLGADADIPASPPASELRAGRKAYDVLATDRLRGPHESLSREVTGSGRARLDNESSASATDVENGGWEHNNPLSQDLQNPWQQWFADSELREVIRQDVERAFPDVPYFAGQHVQEMLITVLFLYCTTHPSIGYRQGMHEILGSVVMALDYDSVDPSQPCEAMESDIIEFCSRDYVAADSYILFDVIMRGIRRWYEWQEPRSTRMSSDVRSTWISPIVQACTRIQDRVLRAVDPVLWGRMNGCGIEPQIYGMRWLRLLFTREFSLSDAMLIWDALFAMDASLDLAEWVCVAMLVRIRNLLLAAGDYAGMLTCLLRYPGSSPSLPYMIVKHAVALRSNPVPAEAVTAMMENHARLGTSASVEELPKRGPPHKKSAADTTPHHPSRSQRGLTELIAKSLIERGETIGLNRALLTTVSELRRNLPDLPNLSRAIVHNSILQSSYSEANTADVHGLSQIEHDEGQLRRQLGRAMEWALQTLEGRPWSDAREREALLCLQHVRDVLLENTDVIVSRLDASRRGRVDMPNESSSSPRTLSGTMGVSSSVSQQGVRLRDDDRASTAVLASLPRIPQPSMPPDKVPPTPVDRVSTTQTPFYETGSSGPSVPVSASRETSGSQDEARDAPSRVQQNRHRLPRGKDDTRRTEPLDPLGALSG